VFHGLDEVTGLRNVLRWNAAFSVLTGLVAVLAGSGVTEQLGFGAEAVLWVRLVGVGLLAFAGMVLLIAASPAVRLVPAALEIAIADLGWVLATVAMVAAGAFSTPGAVAAGIIALVVLEFAVLQLRARARARRAVAGGEASLSDLGTVEAVRFERELPASANALWPVMTDHTLYAELAMNLATASAVTPNGPGLVRECSDASGKTWSETCTLWDPGHRFAVEVDTDADDYPYPLTMLQGSWGVAPALRSQGSRVTMAFVLQPEPGPRGGLMVLVMQAGLGLVLARVARGWQRAASSESRAGSTSTDLGATW